MSDIKWVRDEPRVRAFDGKQLLVKTKEGNGIFRMRVKETAPDGQRRDGYVLVELEPYDLNSIINSEAIHSKLLEKLV